MVSLWPIISSAKRNSNIDRKLKLFKGEVSLNITKHLRGKRLWEKVLPLVLITSIFLWSGSISWANEEQEHDQFPQRVAEEVYGKSAKLPKLDTKSITVYSPDTNTLVFEKNQNKKIYPYSTTKVLTAYIVSEKLPLDKVVTVSKEAAAVGDSSMNLVEGEQVTVEQLLYGLLLPSGNDAAYALAEAVSGSIPKFAKLMNETARSFGCKDSHFVNPNGLKEDDHYSTSHDMAIIFNKAMTKPLIKKIAGTLEYQLPATNKQPARTLYNTCKLMRNPENKVVAAKTGSWDYENSLLFETKYQGVNYIVSMMGSNIDVREREAEAIIERIRSAAVKYSVGKTGETLGKVKFYGSNIVNIPVGTKKDLTVKLPANLPKDKIDTLVHTKIDLLDKVSLPIDKGTIIAKMTVSLGGNQDLSTFKLVSQDNVDKGWILSKIGISNKATIVGGTLLVIILALLRNWHNRRMRKKKVRNRREAVIERIKKDIEERK